MIREWKTNSMRCCMSDLHHRSPFAAVKFAPSLCADAEYMHMRLGRMGLVDPPGRVLSPGVVSPADRLKQYCATLEHK